MRQQSQLIARCVTPTKSEKFPKNQNKFEKITENYNKFIK